MSDTPNIETRPDTTPAPAPKDDAKPTKPTRTRGQKWRRRIIVALVTFILCVVAFRALVPLLLPTVMRQVAGMYDLNAEYDSLDFSLLSADVGIWNLRFTPKSGGEPVLVVRYCRAAVSQWGLLQGRLDVDRAEAEEALVNVERLSDGSIPLLERFMPKPDPTATTQPLSIPLEPPFSIKALRLQGGQARLIDRAVSPTTDVRLYLNLILSDIGSNERPTNFSVQLNSPELLGALYVDGDATARNNLVSADVKVRMIGLNLQPLRTYLAAFGVTPTADDISATANGKLKITPANGPTTRKADDPITAVAVKLDLEEIYLTADSQYAASAKRVAIDIPTASPGEVRIDSVVVDGVRAYAWRDEQGRPGFAGIALGAEPSTVVQKPESKTTQPASSQDIAIPSQLPVFSLRSLLIRDTGFEFVDFAIPQKQKMSFDIDKIELTNISTDPKDADLPSTLAFHATSPGLADSISITGDIRAATPVKSVDLKIDIGNITGAALDAYLAPFGVRRAMHNARFTANIKTTIDPADEKLTAGLKLTDVKLVGDDQEWFAFSSVDINNVRLAYDGSKIAFGTIDIRGPKFEITRASDGAITTLGFTLDPSKIQPPQPAKTAVGAPSTSTTQPAAKLKLPLVQIDSLTWKDVSISVNDAAVKPAMSYQLVDVDVAIENLTLDQKAKDVQPGKIAVSLMSPGNVETFNIAGTVAPTGEAIAFQLTGGATGVTLAGLRPLLNTFGIDPLLDSGKLDFTIGGDARMQNDALSASLTLRDISLVDQSGDWIKLNALALTKAGFDGKTASAGILTVDKPVLRVERDSAGRLSVAGMKLITPPNAPPPPPVDPTLPPIPSRVTIDLPIIAKLGELKLDSATINFIDNAVKPAAKLQPTVSFTLQNAVLGADAPPAPFTAAVSMPGAIGELKASGSLQASPTQQGIQVTVTGKNLGGDAFKSYLPRGITTSTNTASLNAEADISLKHNPKGGSSLSLQARNVLLHDGLRDDPALKLDSASIVIDQFDLDKPDKVIAIKEIVTRGFAIRVFEDDRGFVVPMLIAAASPVDAGANDAKPVEQQQLVGEAVDVEKLMQASRMQSPLVTIGKLDIGAEQLSVQTKQLAYPITLRELSLTGAGIELLGTKPEERPAFDLVLATKLDRLVESVKAKSTLRPFAREPIVKLNLDVTGIHGSEVTSLIPQLAEHIDGQGLSDGRFTTDLDAQLFFTRRGLFGIDLTRDIGGSFTIKNTALTQTGVEKPLAGVEEIRGEQLRISLEPMTINLRSLEITKPAAHIYRDKDGIHALGMMYKLPVEAIPATVPVDIPAQNDLVADAPAPPVEVPPSTAGKTVGGVAVGSLTVSGCDIVIEDRVGKPVTVLPFNELDVEVTGLNTRALTEPIPVKFSVLAGSAKTPMVNEDGSSAEERELFAQFTASGVVTAYPKPQGWIKSSLSAFDLRSVKGIAQQMGIEIGNGTFDFSTDVRMQGGDTFKAKLAPTFNDLRVTDSPDGKIQRFMALPFSLDAAIVAVEDSDGAISIPVTAPIEAGKLDVGAVVGSAVGAITGQVIKAVAAAPLKAASGLAGIIGIDLSKEKDLTPVTVAFSPGESLLTADQETQIKQMIERLKQDETLQIALTHSLGTADMVLSDQRANPSREDAEAIASRLRERKFDLQKRRVALSSTLRIAMASQNKPLADQTLTDLQRVSTELAETEEGLDDMLGLLRPGAQRYADRRAKASAIELGLYRLETVKARFLESNVKDIANRVAIARPNAKLENAPEQGQVEIKFARRAKQ